MPAAAWDCQSTSSATTLRPPVEAVRRPPQRRAGRAPGRRRARSARPTPAASPAQQPVVRARGQQRGSPPARSRPGAAAQAEEPALPVLRPAAVADRRRPAGALVAALIARPPLLLLSATGRTAPPAPAAPPATARAAGGRRGPPGSAACGGSGGCRCRPVAASVDRRRRCRRHRRCRRCLSYRPSRRPARRVARVSAWVMAVAGVPDAGRAEHVGADVGGPVRQRRRGLHALPDRAHRRRQPAAGSGTRRRSPRRSGRRCRCCAAADLPDGLRAAAADQPDMPPASDQDWRSAAPRRCRGRRTPAAGTAPAGSRPRSRS